jgi:hypothetical protein
MDEIDAMQIYLSWSLQRAKLRGGKGRPIEERLLEFVAYNNAVKREQEATGCLRGKAIEAVAKRSLPSEITQKYPYIRKKAHSEKALERMLTPAHGDKLRAEYKESIELEERVKALQKLRALSAQRSWHAPEVE